MQPHRQSQRESVRSPQSARLFWPAAAQLTYLTSHIHARVWHPTRGLFGASKSRGQSCFRIVRPSISYRLASCLMMTAAPLLEERIGHEGLEAMFGCSWWMHSRLGSDRHSQVSQNARTYRSFAIIHGGRGLFISIHNTD